MSTKLEEIHPLYPRTGRKARASSQKVRREQHRRSIFYRTLSGGVKQQIGTEHDLQLGLKVVSPYNVAHHALGLIIDSPTMPPSTVICIGDDRRAIRWSRDEGGSATKETQTLGCGKSENLKLTRKQLHWLRCLSILPAVLEEAICHSNLSPDSSRELRNASLYEAENGAETIQEAGQVILRKGKPDDFLNASSRLSSARPDLIRRLERLYCKEKQAHETQSVGGARARAT